MDECLINYIEFKTNDIEKTKEFYSKVFGQIFNFQIQTLLKNKLFH